MARLDILRSDNRPEFVSRIAVKWLTEANIDIGKR